MKKTIFSMLTLALAAMTMVSCSSDIDDFEAKKENKGGITFIADMPDVYGSTRTEMEFGADGKVTNVLWSAVDGITVVTDAYNDPTDPEWSSNNEFKYVKDNNEVSKTAIFKMDQNEHFNNKGDINNASYVFAYHGSSSLGYGGYNTEKKTVDITLHSIQEPAKNMFDSAEDILISNAVALEKTGNNENKSYNLKFKRISGVIRLNILPERVTEDAGVKGLRVSKVVMTTNDKTEDFTGKVSITVDDYTTPQIEGGEIVVRRDGKAIDIRPKNYKVAEEGNSIYMNVLPTIIHAGKPLTITVTAGTKTLKKEIILKNDVEIPAGKITTLNVKFRDPDYKEPTDPNQPTEATVVGNVITTNGEGHLTETIINNALSSNQNQLKIVGNVNAADLTVLASIAKNVTTAFDLDFSGANIIGGETYNGGILKDNTIPGKCFSGWNLNSLELPKSVTTLEQWSCAKIPSLQTLTIGYKTTYIGQDLLSESEAVTTLIVLAGPSCELQTTGSMAIGWEEYMISFNLTLKINKDCEAYPGEIIDSYSWKDIYFADAYTVTVDENGNYTEN